MRVTLNATFAALIALPALGGILLGSPASAGTLQVNPVLIQVDAVHRTGSVTVRNVDAAPVTIHAYALAWRQLDGDDRYDDNADLIVSPPVFTIAPGATQVVRVGRRNPGASAAAYRLIIEEVPEASPMTGIRIALRVNLPLYASVPAAEPETLRWTASRGGDGSWLLEASNPGTGYVRIDPEIATAATGLRFGSDVAFGTVLPGATRRWRLGSSLQIADARRLEHILGAPERGAIRTAQSRP